MKIEIKTSVRNNSNTDNWLLKYRKNIFSQYGEDGVIEKIFSILPHLSKWCVEFGAWDGKHLSNTHQLLSQRGYSGVLIEADQDKFRTLCQTYSGNNRVACINKMVTFDGQNILDNILSQTSLPKNFDLLSIDIDGNDFHVWKSVEYFKPKLVIIEFNNTIPNSIEFVQDSDYSVNQGCSLLALDRLAKQKGYELLVVTDFNAFFVDAEYFPLFQIPDNSPETINCDQKHITHVFQLFDGTIVWEGNLNLLWHDLNIKPGKMQVLPKYIRYFPDSKASWLRRLLFFFYRKFYL
jgi:hypothetical protein